MQAEWNEIKSLVDAFVCSLSLELHDRKESAISGNTMRKKLFRFLGEQYFYEKNLEGHLSFDNLSKKELELLGLLYHLELAKHGLSLSGEGMRYLHQEFEKEGIKIKEEDVTIKAR